MPTINIKGAGAGQTPPTEPPAAPGALTSAQMSAVIKARREQQQFLKDMAGFWSSFGADTVKAMNAITAEAKAAEGKIAAATKTAADAQQQLFAGIGAGTRTAMKHAVALNKVQAAAAKQQQAVENTARIAAEKAQKDLFAGVGVRTTAAMKAATALGKAEATAAKQKLAAENAATVAADKAQKQLFAGIGAGTRTAMKNAATVAKANEKAAKDQAAADKKADADQKRMFANVGAGTRTAMKAAVAQNKRDARGGGGGGGEGDGGGGGGGSGGRAWSRLARTTALVAAGAHGDVEGLAAGIGGLGGFALGGPVGAEIGEVAGELIAKVGKAIAAAPLLPGQLWQSYMSTSQAYFTPQRQAVDLGGAGGFNGNELFESLRLSKSYAPQPWMAYYGKTQSEALQMLADTGVAPRSSAAGNSMIKDMLATQYTPGFRGLGDSAVTGTLGQGLSAGLTTPAGSLKYLSQFGQVLQKGVPLDIDRSKLLARMTDAIETMVKGGSQVANVGDVSDMFTRFMMAGGPGRGGDNAASTIGGLEGVKNNLGGSTATLYNYMRIAGKFNNFRTDADIEAGLGPEGWKNLQSDPSKDAIIARIKATAGNAFAQNQFVGPLMGDSRLVDLTNGLNQGLPMGIGDIVTSGGLGGAVSPINNVRNQVGRGLAAGGAGNVHAGPTAEQAALAMKVASGTASDGETASLLSAYGVPFDQIPGMMAEAKKRGGNPMLAAIEGWHESRFKPLAFNGSNRNGTVDRGVYQINSLFDKQPDAVANPYDLGYQNRKIWDVLTNNGKSKADLMRANPRDPSWVQYGRDQAAVWAPDGTNMPAGNKPTAYADAANVEGAKTNAELFGGVMVKITGAADAATTSLNNFRTALDNVFNKNELAGGPLRIPPPTPDVAKRVTSTSWFGAETSTPSFGAGSRYSVDSR